MTVKSYSKTRFFTLDRTLSSFLNIIKIILLKRNIILLKYNIINTFCSLTVLKSLVNVHQHSCNDLTI